MAVRIEGPPATVEDAVRVYKIPRWRVKELTEMVESWWERRGKRLKFAKKAARPSSASRLRTKKANSSVKRRSRGKAAKAIR